MHHVRTSMTSGTPIGDASPLREKDAKVAPNDGSLSKLTIIRKETRRGNQRGEDRMRLNEIVPITIMLRRRKHDVELINISTSGVMVQCALDVRIGERIDIQVDDQPRIRCHVRWAREGRIGVEVAPDFDRTSWRNDFVVHALRNEPDHIRAAVLNATLPKTSSSADASALTATVHTWSRSDLTRVHDISSSGAAIEIAGELEEGTPIVLDFGEGGSASGKVRWLANGRAGLVFDQPFDAPRLDKLLAPVSDILWVKSDYIADRSSFSA